MLLTGAGFSKNWGGWLGSEIWERLLANSAVRTDDRLRSQMLGASQLNYESILGDLRDEGAASLDRVAAMESAIVDVFRRQDESQRVNADAANFKHQEFDEFLDVFSVDNGGGGIFTLNQDLFLERISGKRLVTPDIASIAINDGTAFDDSRHVVRVSDAALPLAPIESRSIRYTKLHGSFNWRTSDGNALMISGTRKVEQAERFPLLKNYLNVFRQACLAPNAFLLIVGYGFSDEHINETIVAGARQGLRIAVASVMDARTFQEDLLNPIRNGRRSYANASVVARIGTDSPLLGGPDFYARLDIWRALVGYFSEPLGTVFRRGVPVTLFEEFSRACLHDG